MFTFYFDETVVSSQPELRDLYIAKHLATLISAAIWKTNTFALIYSVDKKYYSFIPLLVGSDQYHSACLDEWLLAGLMTVAQCKASL